MKKYLFITIFVFKLSSISANEKLPWLHTKGKHIVNEKGQPLTLNGINLGGWLVEEMWMLPFRSEPPKHDKLRKITDHVSLWRTIERRFGKEKMDEIRTSFREHWITDQDFARIKAMGFNSVRLPFLYDLKHEPRGLFFWLDRAVASAQKHGLYVILDMHGAPGRQSKEHHTGHSSQNQLFLKSDHVKTTAKIWAEIAAHFKNCSAIAGYDLLNEPMGAPDSKTLSSVYHKIYKAIRQKDKRHIIIMQDGFKGINRMPRHKEYGWKNVILSTHKYTVDAKSANDHLKNLNAHMQKVSQHKNTKNMPFYLGEFNVVPHGTSATVKKVLATIKKKKFSYSLWTYKIGKNHEGLARWGVFSLSKKHKAIDPYSDSFRDIMKKIEHLGTEHFNENRQLADVFRQHNGV